MESWTEVRRRVLKRELSERASCREYEQSWHTLKKILAHQEPPGYRRKQAGRKPKREPFLPLIHEILQQDGQAPKKQRHAWAQLAADEAAAEAARATEVLSEEAIREIAVANANRDYEIAEPTAAATLAGTETDAQATLFVTCANAGVTRATAESSAADQGAYRLGLPALAAAPAAQEESWSFWDYLSFEKNLHSLKNVRS